MWNDTEGELVGFLQQHSWDREGELLFVQPSLLEFYPIYCHSKRTPWMRRWIGSHSSQCPAKCTNPVRKHYCLFRLCCCIALSQLLKLSCFLSPFAFISQMSTPIFCTIHIEGQKLDHICAWALARTGWFIEMKSQLLFSFEIFHWFLVLSTQWEQKNLKTRAFPKAAWYLPSQLLKKEKGGRQHPQVSDYVYTPVLERNTF